MKPFNYLLFWLCALPSLLLAQSWEISPRNDYDNYFQEAYQLYPSIPRGILESIAYNNTRIRHLTVRPEADNCLGLPQYLGVMGLVEDGKDYFQNTLLLVADLSGYALEDIKQNPRINILAYAKAYHSLLLQKNIAENSPEAHYEVLDVLSEIPNNGNPINRFAFETQLYAVYKNLNEPAFQNAYRLPAYKLDLPKVFGEENYQVLSAAKLVMNQDGVGAEQGKQYNPGRIYRSAPPPPCSDVSVGFPRTVLAAPADPGNYSSRSGTAITHVTIHTMQGSYAGSISWFQNPSANVSAHYNIRASDGQITQSVCEIDKAWHVSNSNPYAVGIEHEGYTDDPTWYTDAMYKSSADLTKDIATRLGIPLKRTYDKNGDNGLNPISDGCFKVKGHQHFPAQTHTDPGPYWDWNRYYDLLNPSTAAPTNVYTTCSGSFSDPGAAGNYGNDERTFYRIAPTGASSVTLTFTSFNLELNYDYLYVYDGDSYNDSLIAVLNGTTLPAAIIGRSGKLLLEFRTDCATTASGWVANWTCSTAAAACDEPSGLTESMISYNQVRLDWNDVAGATGYLVKIRRSLASTWDYYTVTTSQADVTGLALDGNYLWQVQTLCGASNSSAWVGREFVNNPNNNTIVTNLCSGRFTDTGGSLGNYRNNENYTFTISPSNAISVTLSFSSFNTEASYDLLRIYDGPSTASPLIGTYSGTTLPPTITSSGGSLTIRFTSDNWTTRSGWIANWSCQSGMPIYGNPVLLDTTMAGNLNCGLTYHDFYDSGNSAGTYSNNENNSMTFCNPDTGLAVRLSFRPNPSAAQQLSISSTTSGNDYLYIYNGASTSANLVGVYTGASSAAPQPGTFISSGACVTVKMETDAATNSAGWIARLYCSARPNVLPTVMVGGTQGNKTFTDLGGAAANYNNNENYIITFRPDASAPAGEVVWADFSATAVGLERNWDYLYVFDGPNTQSRLIAVYTGDTVNTNHLGIIKATAANSSGALTFQFFSDGATTASGWQAVMRTGAARLAYGSDNCATATPMNTVGATYAGSTMIATGRPGNPDPSLNISVASLPQCSGANAISRLENTVWYRFTTPTVLCNATSINVRLDNVSCQSEVPNGSGVQFVLYEAAACLSGAAWGTPLFCADKLVNGNSVDIAPYLQANRSYYIMIDGFTGQHCNFDIKMETVGGSNPNSCFLPLDLLDFKGVKMENHAKLLWTTAYEQDVNGFYLQRANADGITFEDIAFIPSKGNYSADENQYDYADYAYLRKAVNYYRLRELDLDGSSFYHKVVSVDMRDAIATPILNVYPNPAQSQLLFSLQSDWDGDYELRILDATGKQIYNTTGTVTNGFWQEQLDVSSLAAGFYFYQWRMGSISRSGKFEKI